MGLDGGFAATGSEVAVQWRGRTVRAWLPVPLADRAAPDEAAIGRVTERARQAVLHADDRTPTAWEPLARVLLRAEGVASSFIEGVRAEVPDVVMARVDPTPGRTPADWVAANLDVLDAAVAHAHTQQPLALADLHQWHEQLMGGHSSLPPRLIGELRDEVGWIGGTSPLDAALVVAPPDAVPGLVDDVLRYANRTDLDPISQAALGHAQFEVVHPYGDGNGRLGRVLVLWLLARRTGVRVLPPVSTAIAADPGGYLAGLTLFRLSTADNWVRWFADAVIRSAGNVSATMERVSALHTAWHSRLDDLGVRRDAAARRLLETLPAVPVLTSAKAARAVAVSERSARTGLDTLARAGIVERLHDPSAGGHRGRWWFVPEITALATSR